MTLSEALVFIEKHGVVLESANGTVPSLVQYIVGEKIQGSWWTHPQGKAIFRITRAVRDSDHILVCRLLDGKVTLIHQRLWPALVRCAEYFRAEQIAKVIEEHTAGGKHRATLLPFPEWVPASVTADAAELDDDEIVILLKSVGLTNKYFP